MWKNIKSFFKKAMGSDNLLIQEQTAKQISPIKSEPKIKQFKKQARFKKEATYR